MSRDDYDKGMATRRKVLGEAWVDKANATKTAFNEEFQELITRYAWNEIWNRPAIPHRTRRMIVIAQMVALGRWEEFQLHVRAALESGDLSPDDVKEILLQSAIYCGVPAANHAFKEARAVLDALGMGGAAPMSGVQLFHRVSGAGDPVVLVHAIGCDHTMWDSLSAALSPSYRVIRVDVRGHGQSPVTPRPYTLELLADDIAALLDGMGIARAHYVGLSMGGMIGQAFAMRHGAKLDRLVIANSTSGYGPDGPANWRARIKAVEDGGLEAIRDMVAARYFSDAFRASHPQKVTDIMQKFVRTPREGYLACCDAIARLDYTAELGRIEAPTLVIAGALDAGTPPAMSETLARGIRGAKLEVIPGAAHLAAVEAPRAFDHAVLRFLAGA